MQSQSIKIFKCPSCGAPLDPEKDATSMKCPYCGASVVIPSSMRSTPTGTLSDVTRLAREGKLDEAARIYSKITGLSHENAMFSVKSMAGVRDDTPDSNTNPFGAQQASPSYQAPSLPQPVYNQPTVRVRGGSCLSGIIRLVVLFVILGSAVPSILKALQFKLPTEITNLQIVSGQNPIIPEPFGKEVFSFGASVAKDPRTIGVDGSGNILVFNYNSSSVQIFDPQGTQLSEIIITENNGNKLNNDSMGVTSDGIMYIPGFQSIMIFNEKGERLGEIRDQENLFIIYSVMVAPDNGLYVRSNTGIVRITSDKRAELVVSDAALEEASGETPGFGAMGVDTQGNIYFTGDFNSDILKFSPNGEFISSFGWDFSSVREIAFDAYGRMYVVDFSDVKVFDTANNYIDSIDGAFWGVDFDSQGYMYAVTTQSDDVVKYEVKAPAAP